MSQPMQFVNNAVSTSVDSLANDAGSIQLRAGDGAMFPSGAEFRLTLEDRRIWPVQREIVHCTSRSGDTLYIRRAQEGTTAKHFLVGYTISNRITAGALNVIMQSGQTLTEYWLGVHSVPPTVGNDGGPIPTGAMYFNSTTYLTYTWDGTAWRSLLVPQNALTIRLFYVATGGETEFGETPDLRGFTLQLNEIDQAPVMVYRNGELLWIADGTGARGDYTVDWVDNKIVLTTPAVAGDEYELDQLVPTSRLPPAATDTRPLRDINLDPVTGLPGYIDGVRSDFPLKDPDGLDLTIDDPYQLGIFLDGVHQRPMADYTVASSTLHFLEVPPAGTTFWGFYYGVRGGTILTVPAPTVPGQILIASPALEPEWSTVLDEGVF